MVNIRFCYCIVEVWRFDKSEKEFIDQLHMSPSQFVDGFILIWVVDISDWVDWRWDWSEYVGFEHVDNVFVHFLREVYSRCADEDGEFVQGYSFQFFPLNV